VKLENRFGMTLEIDPKTLSYEALYMGGNWLGGGIVSALHGGAWYRTHRSASAPCGDIYPLETSFSEEESGGGRHARFSAKLGIRDAGITFGVCFRFFYEKPCIVFDVEYPDMEDPPAVVFPQFACGRARGARDGLHSWTPGFMGYYGMRHGITAAEGFADPDRPDTAVPLVLFDDSLHTVILSPFSNYLVSHQTVERPGGGLGHGFDEPLIGCALNRHFHIPRAFRHSTILYAGEGIRRTLLGYGDELLAKGGKQRPGKYHDRTIGYLSYWTDYGSFYCANWTGGGRFSSLQEALLAVEREADEKGLVINSWEAQDGDQNRWPEGLFEPREDLFPHGLGELSRKLGKPLYAYFSPLEPGPYRRRFPYVYTGRVAYGGIGSVGMGDLFCTEDFWDEQARKAREWGSEGLQHDFLSNYWNTPAAPDHIDRYMKSIAKACVKHGLSMQYCMCFSNHVLETAENPAAISLQAIADHHPSHEDGGCGANLRSFLYSGALYGALGLWPARDNVQTRNDADAYEDVLVANLSGGPVQLGHEAGRADAGLLFRTFREGDGLLLKPDRPICPIDRCFVDDSFLVASTESTHEAGIWTYALCLNIGAAGRRGGLFTLGQCGCGTGRYAVYDYNAGTVTVAGRDDGIAFPDGVKHSYRIIAPLFGGGVALFGDVGKFVTMADQRIADVAYDGKELRFGVITAGKCDALLAGYAVAGPKAVEADGMAVPKAKAAGERNGWCWNEETRVWTLRLTRQEAHGEKAIIRIICR
jgi:hypothetical protein